MKPEHHWEVHGIKFRAEGEQRPDGQFSAVAVIVGTEDFDEPIDPPLRVVAPLSCRYAEDAIGVARDFIAATGPALKLAIPRPQPTSKGRD